MDADIGLFVADHRQPHERGFVDVRPSMLDTEATWVLIKTMLDSGRVESILLDQSLIRQLQTYLRQNEILGEDEIERIFPPPGTPRAWEMDGIVRHAAGHRNHFHVRARCD
jgi:hypothetical protein